MAVPGRSPSSAASWRSAAGRWAPRPHLLGTNGVRTGADVARMALAGASAIEATSVVMEQGFGALARIVAELTRCWRRASLRFAI